VGAVEIDLVAVAVEAKVAEVAILMVKRRLMIL